MKTRIISGAALLFLFSFAIFSAVSAQSINVADINRNRNMERQRGVVATTTRGNATSTAAKNSRNATTSANMKKQLNAEMHRSVVATAVQSLLTIADRENGIGGDVRGIARMQSDLASTSAEAIKKIENRSRAKTFLVGSDYKNLGQIRSEITTTQNNVHRLKNLLMKTASSTNRIELVAQIRTLENSQKQLDAFVREHEDSFSLLGWVVKLFAK